MNQVKCECGHVNPHGTILCEACGKPLSENENKQKLVDMRYEGSARRSQTYNKTIVDKIWNFFSSVKVGVMLIVITLIASAFGTIFPQEMYIPPQIPPSEFYREQYGWFGQLYYELGFHNLYSSWWYLLLIASIGVSLVICSLDRVIPLYRALKKQRVTRNEGFLQRQRFFSKTNVKLSDDNYNLLKEKLKSKRYHIREENGNLLAEKGRFSRWGPYVNHVGLIIFLIGGMLRFVPGMYVDKVLWVREGETKLIPETNGEYYLKNNQFILETYNSEKDGKVFADAIDRAGVVAKNYQSNVTLYKKEGNSLPGEPPQLEKLKDGEIRVNEPFKFEDYALYQTEFKLNELSTMTFALSHKETGEEFGTLTIDLNEPKTEYPLSEGYEVEMMSYFPDFEFNNDGEPSTKSKIPNNPGFIFKMYTPDKPDGEISFVAIRQTIEPDGDNQYKMTFKEVETKNVSGLTVRKDLTLWIIALGGAIFMLGVCQGSFWYHRRIWIYSRDNQVWLAAHTNKNWHSLKQEIAFVLDGTGVEEPNDQLNIEKDG
ncbi:cytochrome c biogenesis protein ResB [Niallia sp. XMNu-256]|uniref:cytochrome c biogenesis protein ResB n=1 Tax=Niallia sp. XMNu-256 TaxID=3082444 RepID=UPI0030D62966